MSDVIWYKYYDAGSGRNYYYNSTSGENVWDEPAEGEIQDPQTHEVIRSSSNAGKSKGKKKVQESSSSSEESESKSSSSEDESSSSSEPPPPPKKTKSKPPPEKEDKRRQKRKDTSSESEGESDSDNDSDSSSEDKKKNKKKNVSESSSEDNKKSKSKSKKKNVSESSSEEDNKRSKSKSKKKVESESSSEDDRKNKSKSKTDDKKSKSKSKNRNESSDSDEDSESSSSSSPPPPPKKVEKPAPRKESKDKKHSSSKKKEVKFTDDQKDTPRPVSHKRKTAKSMAPNDIEALKVSQSIQDDEERPRAVDDDEVFARHQKSKSFSEREEDSEDVPVNKSSMPVNIQASIDQYVETVASMPYKFLEYMEDKGRPAKAGKNVPKKAKKDSIICYYKDELNESLLVEYDKVQSKDAVMICKILLKYCGVKEYRKIEGRAKEILHIVKEDPSMIDEIYVQIMRLTNKSPPEVAKKALNVMLMMASLHKPSKELDEIVYIHLARIAKEASSDIKQNALTAFFRYDSAHFKYFRYPNTFLPKYLHRSIFSGFATLYVGVGLHEMLFYQSRRYPKLLLPIVVPQCCDRMLELNAEKTVGIFRLPGNLALVKEINEKINRGQTNYLEGADLNTIASFFKGWFREISGFVVTQPFVADILKIKTRDDAIAIAERLPEINKATLMYLVGFLNRLAKQSEVTQMDADKLSMCLAPNIVYSGEDDTPDMITRQQSMSHIFLQYLVEAWDFSKYYPIDSKALKAVS